MTFVYSNSSQIQTQTESIQKKVPGPFDIGTKTSFFGIMAKWDQPGSKVFYPIIEMKCPKANLEVASQFIFRIILFEGIRKYDICLL